MSDQTLTTSEKAQVYYGNTLEWWQLVDKIIRERRYYNFQQIHLISHYVEQIPKFGALEQFSTDINEIMPKAFKHIYHQSNRVDSML